MYFSFNIPDILENSVERSPDKVAVIEGSREITYQELSDRSDAVALYLREQRIEIGDRVGIFLNKSIETVISILGISKAGGVFVNINPKLTAEQVGYRSDNCRMSHLISSDRRIKIVHSFINCPITNINDFDEIYGNYTDSDKSSVNLIGRDLAAILYTSGSTGMPKGVVLNHENIVMGSKIVATYLENNENDRIISVLPFNFDYGLNQLFTSILVGGTLVIQKSLFPNDICETLVEKKITGFAGVPSIWVMLLNPKCSFRKLDYPHLRYITNSGGAVPVSYINELRGSLKTTKIFLMYGLTEAFRSTYLPPDQLEKRPTSMGKAIPNVRIDIIGEDGKECPPGEEGELVHSGGVIFQGYWNNQEATDSVLKAAPNQPEEVVVKDMAVWSGDIVKKDEDGFLYFVGRNDAMIKCLGNRISPREVEDIVYKYPLVKEVAVFGIKDDLLGNKIVAILSLHKKETPFSEKDLSKFCRDHLPDYMIPREVKVVQELPKTSNGKIDRVKIKDDYISSI